MQALKQWVLRHPNLAAWIALAVGMNGILLFEARDVGLLPMQWFWLILITTLVADVIACAPIMDRSRPEPYAGLMGLSA